MARPTTRKRDSVSLAVIKLRTALGDSQQQFAARLGVAITTIARWETQRPPGGKVLHALERLARTHKENDLAMAFSRALALEMDSDLEPEQQIWTAAIGELFRNRKITPGWPRVAKTIRLELESLVKAGNKGLAIQGPTTDQAMNLAHLEGILLELRMKMDGSAEQILEALTRERMSENPNESRQQAYAFVIAARPELYEQYNQEKADAARGTSAEASLAVFGTKQHAQKAKKAKKS